MKILLFGSGFNPPHNGHLALLRLAVSQRKPDLVLLVPTGTRPPMKVILASSDGRFRMAQEIAKIIVEKCSVKCEVLDFELKSKKLSYTYNTLRHVSRLFSNCEIDLLMGSDMLFYLNKWHRFTDLIKQCTIIAAVRTDEDRRRVTSAAVAIKSLGGQVDILALDPVVTSSTDIRRLIQEGKPYGYLLPKGVEQIIKKEKLYRPTHLRYLALEVKKTLSKRRFHHTLMVCKMAINLSRAHGYDTYKSASAALLHDIAKEFSREKMLQLLNNSDIIFRWQDTFFPIWHGFAGAEYAKKELGVLDESILDAIRFHSVGRKGMTRLDKIIFLSDMVSEDREFEEVLWLRQMSTEDLDKALLEALKLNLEWLRQDGKDITIHTVEAIEELERSVEESKKKKDLTSDERKFERNSSEKRKEEKNKVSKA